MAIEVPADLDATEYATVDDIDEVAETHAAKDAWNALTDSQKEAAAATANREIDFLEASPGFIGDRVDADQNLAWPRTGTEYSEDAWPVFLIQAVIERAIEYASSGVFASSINPLSPSPSTGNVKSLKVGPIEKEFFAPTGVTVSTVTGVESFGIAVQRLLKPLLLAEVVGGWGSATVVRAS